LRVGKTKLGFYVMALAAAGAKISEAEYLEMERKANYRSEYFDGLSDSTEAYDRGKKFEHYRQISTLKDYILISQTRLRRFTRAAPFVWASAAIRA
jgi:hypothetical protein